VRLGPVLEAVIEGKYYWIPFQNLLMIEIDPPTDLRDVVWAPARLILAAGGEKVALIPTRYPGSEAASNPAAVRLARTMQFGGADGETPLGLRVLNTDQSEYALFDIARVKLGDPAALKAALAAVQAQRAEEMQAKLIASGALKTGLPGMTADGGAGAGGGGVGGGHG
jgi:type VI secretion system protein ImpE